MRKSLFSRTRKSASNCSNRQSRIISNKAGRDVTGVKWCWPQVAEAFRDPQLWFCMVNAFLSSVPNGGLTTFGSIINKNFGFTELQVLLVEIPRSVMSVIIFIIVGFYTRAVPERRMYIMAAACIPPFVGLLAMSMLDRHTPGAYGSKDRPASLQKSASLRHDLFPVPATQRLLSKRQDAEHLRLICFRSVWTTLLLEALHMPRITKFKSAQTMIPKTHTTFCSSFCFVITS